MSCEAVTRGLGAGHDKVMDEAVQQIVICGIALVVVCLWILIGAGLRRRNSPWAWVLDTYMLLSCALIFAIHTYRYWSQ